MTERRVTPSAVRVLPADADRQEWLAARRLGIGSSDVPAILGLAARRTPLHVYRDKRGELVDQQTEEMLWGSLLEAPVAEEWQRRNRSVVARVGLVANRETRWAMATLDRRVAECPMDRSVRQRCGLECKCRDAGTRHRWRGDVPDDVYAQVAWQMEVTGFDHMHVAVLIGGNDYRQTVVRRDRLVGGYVFGEVTKFRDEHIVPGVPPAFDPDKAAALIELDNLVHPDRSGTVELDVAQIGEVMEYADASAAHGRALKRLKVARAKLAELADGHQVVKFGDELAYEFGPVTKATPDLERLAGFWPEAFADCVEDKTHYSIRLAPEFRHAPGGGEDG